MWSKQRQRIERLEGLRVGELFLRDARDLKTAEYTPKELAPVRRAWGLLHSFMAKRRPGVQTCAASTVIQDGYHEAFASYQKDHLDATTDDFELAYDPIIDDTLADPRLHTLTFVVSIVGSGELAGLFHLHNIRVLESSPRALVVSAMASPAFKTRRGFIHPDDLGPLMNALLERDIKFRDSSRVFDMKEWIFPTDRRGHTWVDRGPMETCALTLGHLDDHDRTDKTVEGQAAPHRITRKAVRR